MENKLSLRSILLAGVGSIAYSLERGMELINEMVEKGELTVAQGKELNQELRNKYSQQKSDNDNALGSSRFQEFIASINPATKEDIQQLEARISRLEKQLP